MIITCPKCVRPTLRKEAVRIDLEITGLTTHETDYALLCASCGHLLGRLVALWLRQPAAHLQPKLPEADDDDDRELPVKLN